MYLNSFSQHIYLKLELFFLTFHFFILSFHCNIVYLGDLGISFVRLLSKSAFHSFNYNFSSTPCHAIILSIVRFDDCSFTLWGISIFTFFITVILLVGLRIPRFPNSFFFVCCASWYIICRIFLCASCSCHFPDAAIAVITLVAFVALVELVLLYLMNALLLIFLYFFIA